MARNWIAAVAMIILAAPGMAIAHTMVKSVSVADGAKLTTAPKEVTVMMGHPVGVGGVSLATAAGKDVPLSWKPSRAVTESFTVPLPKLAPDTYRFSWRTISDDGHVMNGGVSFTVVRPAARESSWPTIR